MSLCTIRRSPYKIYHFRGVPETFDAIFKFSISSEQVRQILVAVWSTPEKFAEVSYIIGYLNFFPENLCVRQVANSCVGSKFVPYRSKFVPLGSKVVHMGVNPSPSPLGK